MDFRGNREEQGNRSFWTFCGRIFDRFIQVTAVCQKSPKKNLHDFAWRSFLTSKRSKESSVDFGDNNSPNEGIEAIRCMMQHDANMTPGGLTTCGTIGGIAKGFAWCFCLFSKVPEIGEQLGFPRVNGRRERILWTDFLGCAIRPGKKFVEENNWIAAVRNNPRLVVPTPAGRFQFACLVPQWNGGTIEVNYNHEAEDFDINALAEPDLMLRLSVAWEIMCVYLKKVRFCTQLFGHSDGPGFRMGVMVDVFHEFGRRPGWNEVAEQVEFNRVFGRMLYFGEIVGGFRGREWMHCKIMQAIVDSESRHMPGDVDWFMVRPYEEDSDEDEDGNDEEGGDDPDEDDDEVNEDSWVVQ